MWEDWFTAIEILFHFIKYQRFWIYFRKKNMKPSFFCIGAPKTGTTSLFSVLLGNGGLFDSKLKEPSFLTYQGKRDFILKDGEGFGVMDTWAETESEYQNLFIPDVQGQLTADFSTHSLKEIETFTKNGIKLYGEEFINSPILVILREPISRAFSHYAMKVRDGGEQLSFSEAIDVRMVKDRLNKGYLPTFDYLGFSRYKAAITFLKRNFSKVLIIDYKEFRNDFNGVLAQINTFVGIQGDIDVIPPIYNRSGAPKKGLVSSILHKMVYQDNWIKKMIPNAIKTKLANRVKEKTYQLTMNPLKISESEHQLAFAQLKDEITFYEDLFKKD